MKGEGFDVVCPGCKGRFHETTEYYDGDLTSRGHMFRLKSKYGPAGFNWSSFYNSTDIKSGDLECPSCGAPYCSGGAKVTVIEQTLEKPEPVPPVAASPEEKPARKKTEAHVCPKCGKTLPTSRGLTSHMRFCKAAE
jgi:DNA-directed RNA polymerase subunit RPC12/RpoP